jgi:hypothetical protein
MLDTKKDIAYKLEKGEKVSERSLHGLKDAFKSEGQKQSNIQKNMEKIIMKLT